MAVEASLRFATSGFYGALTQAFRRVEPALFGTLGAMVLLPAMAHTMEYLVHSWHGTPELGRSITLSVICSAGSTLLTLSLMRRGYLLVGEKQTS